MVDVFYALISIWLIYNGISTLRIQSKLSQVWEAKGLPMGDQAILAGGTLVILSGALVFFPTTRTYGLIIFNVFLLTSLVTIHKFWKKDELPSVLTNLAYIGFVSVVLANNMQE